MPTAKSLSSSTAVGAASAAMNLGGLNAQKQSFWRRKSVRIAVITFVVIAVGIAVVVASAFLLWKPKRQPDIIMFIADDLGWSDVSFHSCGQIPTPNLDAMCSDAVLLSTHYAQKQCTPSRAALLTGKYPGRLGLQEFPFVAGELHAMPLNHTLLPEYLRRLGYSTHLIGKWHLGYYSEAHLPHKRGFDTFYGYYNGAGTYYNHTIDSSVLDMELTHMQFGHDGYDWYHNGIVDRSVQGKYVTDVITDRVKYLIKERDPEKPLFLMISHMAVHGSTGPKVLEVDDHWVKDPAIEHIKDETRTEFAGMVRALDASFGETVKALDEADMLSNSAILFTSDNGGPSVYDAWFRTGASNWPLRGQKFTSWEGAVRVASFLWSPLLKSQRYANSQLYHFTDWLPTFYKLAGGHLEDLPEDLDGHDIWESIDDNSDSPRTEMIVDYDTGGIGYFAVRRGQYKLVNGTPPDIGQPWFDKWYAVAGGSTDDYMDLQRAMKQSTVYDILQKQQSFEDREDDWREAGKIRCKTNLGLADSPRGHAFIDYSVEDMKFASTVKNATVCDDPRNGACLFDLNFDPCELVQYMGPDREEIMKDLFKMAEDFSKKVLPAVSPWATRNTAFLEESRPEIHDDLWGPWL